MTCRELLDGKWSTPDMIVLASRVEKVLARAEYLQHHGGAGPFIEELLRLLDGEEP
jgi:hypothetical protein